METHWTPPRNGRSSTRRSENGDPTPDRHQRSSPFRPSADVFETRDDLVVELELPGHELQDISVEIERHELTVRVERRAGPSPGRTYHRSERPDGPIARTFTLPASVDADRTCARYENGVLTVQLPKVEEAKPRKIPILTGD
jgi:HSP20 family protein